MSLMLGSGPFGQRPAGSFNSGPSREDALLYLEASPRRIRGELGGETVVDARHARLLHEQGRLPVYYFPADEVRSELLEPTGETRPSPAKGDEERLSLRLGDRVVRDAAWRHPHPPEGAPPLAGLYAFRWDALDAWWEEDEPAIVHARDPYHRVDVVPSSRHVRISLDGETLAESTRALALFETGLPPRWYLPIEDVRADALVESELHTGCAYKGYASYWSVRTGAIDEENLVWTYRKPRREVAPIRDRLAFFNERVDLDVDGERQPRPRSPWSRPMRSADGPPPVP